ncbi:hypothetical protein [Phytohabitans rumicis]|uniref:RNA polymerase sigma-70 region 4 domain-containing protein n=1 Tax=Phytohabitans rumicis TaxID=1076125 RepID=A0A6V8LEJ9_9ACTN|nr:hypothetical protein [Phytohabitans rumicis]GFJ92467.1 hypothetical protein Prum_061090 [Phytohabitans rumicis]
MATPERLRRLAAAARESRKVWETDVDARDAEIDEADREDMPIRAIARHTGLSAGHVQRIVTAQTAARQAG